MTERISRFTDFGEAWFMLDLPEMKGFIIDYAHQAVRSSKSGKAGWLSIDDYFQIWKQKMKDQEPVCQSCRIG